MTDRDFAVAGIYVSDVAFLAGFVVAGAALLFAGPVVAFVGAAFGAFSTTWVSRQVIDRWREKP
jgi:hypothetical protein